MAADARERRLDPLLASVAQELDGPGKAVIVTDESGVILSWSDGAEQLYGWSREEVLGRHVVGVTPTSQSMGDAARIMSRLQAGVPWKGEFAVRTKQGAELVVEVLDVPVKRDNGSLAGIIGVSRPAGR